MGINDRRKQILFILNLISIWIIDTFFPTKIGYWIISFFLYLFPDLKIHSRIKNSKYDNKIAFITGGNVGVGYALAAKLLARNVKVYISCNSRSRLQRVIAKLKTIFPKGHIYPLIIDLTNPISIIEGARDYLKLESQLDYLICTETCMPVKFGYSSYSAIWDCITHFSFHRFLSTGRNRENDNLPFDQPVGITTTQISELKNLLTQSNHTSLILWSGSVFSCKGYFSWEDPQCISSKDPYGATKYLQDILSLAINDQFPNNCISIVACPGFYVTSQSHLLLRLLEPLFLLLSLYFPAIHVFGCKASNVFMKIIQEYEILDKNKKYTLYRDKLIIPDYSIELNKKEAFTSLHDNGDIVHDGIFKELDTSVNSQSIKLTYSRKK